VSESLPPKKGRLQLLLIAAVFLGPLLIAALLYFQGSPLQPAGRTNHGALLEPHMSLRVELSGLGVGEHYDGTSWLLLYSNPDPCNDGCRNALYTLRQSRLMLGKEMDRLRRVFLHGDTVPDTVFVAEEHQGLITIEDGSLAGLLNNKRPVDLPAGGYFLIDPLGNLVMYFRPDIDPADMVDDIKHLLRLSRIG
jgi:hypothetical protein